MIDTFRFLEALHGEWSLERQIVSNQATIAIMKGMATFTALSKIKSRYLETGLLKLLNKAEVVAPISFSRSYIYSADANMIIIDFDEQPPRFFQRFALQAEGVNLVAHAQHFCINDTYTSQYTFQMPSKFNISHKVLGPNKSYTIISDYSRKNES